jgi:hypothetical protein
MCYRRKDYFPPIPYARVYPVYVGGRFVGRMLALSYQHAVWLARLRHGNRARIGNGRR